ncbi:succinate dehydrogenase, hydrophobic membrane anchor protein [Salipiger bermudensis]|uniref:Succinate dehydrogenase, hydrophobic membrane anchor protein n=1 Tax=Salipiger bermudensis (strain DSM 26914 / JCM 13377 / KCTC 12554 / HTCC2601) TaxID=314265 RepID=Q0FNG4_SALBH|nr:succinate dehydrogenase, hydrophobic membrane anchor protein [Salipiger bermudensis]MAE88641.1 succinate dehydrogenase [Pelagibaca sp.]MBR9891027.1 succinate dehydrogenase, hydrophobic membrane anchor protein [bacterium]EAU45780.1 succinate dehydrogenase, hydrophobic membrane anchor protein [Salipiger bermudensis HTCC2601]MBN9676571.1 succinate dehydrogenase, hydrophobic membrane anchor protein [Salipiger bermudensis]MCA1287313.1 succinate dehydrogenase, hydrophobic membrane anchor protein |tara:strand:- start:112 stop:483 length:372 start_codon:yes stop_codon:yes gene_type:complete
MRYLTDRKRAVGKGSAHAGAEHHWFMIVSSVALAFMLPTWLIVFGRALGSGYDAALDTMSRPFPAILTALVLIVGMVHFQKGARTMIEDYTGGTTRKLLIMAFAGFAYLMIACGIFALVKIAL